VLSAFWIYDVSNGAVREHQLFYPRTHHGQSYYGAPPATVVYGAAIQNSYDGMRRLTGMSKRNDDWVTWTPIVANATYNLNGQMTSMQYNGLTESRDYNALGQLTSIRYNGTLRHEYRYSATANDGRITSYKNWQSGEDVEYQYDSLGRLSLAQTVGPQWGQAFSYDGFGNLVGKAVTKGSAPVLSVGVDAATNRLTGVSGLSYDANGNR
jgi:YD repeat-containing protein